MTEQELVDFKNEDFLSKEIASTINKLTEKSTAKWGIMTPQHMVEHITGSFRISNGDIRLEAKEVPNSEKKKASLMKDVPFEKNIITSGGKEPQLRDLKFKSLDEAKAEFFKQLIAFFSHFELNRKDTFFHPAFGELNYSEWLQFHYKHVSHHLRQFGLLDE